MISLSRDMSHIDPCVYICQTYYGIFDNKARMKLEYIALKCTMDERCNHIFAQ